MLRTFAVFAIVLGHTLRNATVVYPWLYSFHVPLCVLTSGIVFHVGQKRFGTFLKEKFRTLMIPYYCFALISIVIYAILGSKMEKTVRGGNDVSPLQSIIGMLYANSGTSLMRWNNGMTAINCVGRNTVGIMVMHKFPILFFVGLFPISKKLIGTYPLIISIMVAILLIGMCLAVSEVIYRVCPIALGKRKR